MRFIGKKKNHPLNRPEFNPLMPVVTNVQHTLHSDCSRASGAFAQYWEPFVRTCLLEDLLQCGLHLIHGKVFYCSCVIQLKFHGYSVQYVLKTTFSK